MNCPNCGTQVVPGDAFCPSCGADVRAVTAQTGAETPGAKKPLSTGAVVGIVAAILFGLLLVCGVGAFVARGILKPKQPTVAEAPAAVSKPKATTDPAKTPGDTSAPATGGTTAGGAPPSSPPSDGLVTDSEAREVVGKFINLRIKGDIEGSKALCSKKMLSGESGSFVNDKYWHPDSFEITKTTPDLMFIHVTTMGDWPSGREPTIYSVWRDPESGKVVIDGMLDPESAPDLVKP